MTVEEQDRTIAELGWTIEEQGQTIAELGRTIEAQMETLSSLQQQVEHLLEVDRRRSRKEIKNAKRRIARRIVAVVVE